MKFPITLTFTLDSAEELRAVINALCGGQTAGSMTETPAAETPNTAKKKTPPKEDAPTKTEEPTPEPAAGEEIPYSAVSAKVVAVAKLDGRAGAEKLLAGFQVAKATELKPEQYAAVMAAADEIIGDRA